MRSPTHPLRMKQRRVTVPETIKYGRYYIRGLSRGPSKRYEVLCLVAGPYRTMREAKRVIDAVRQWEE